MFKPVVAALAALSFTLPTYADVLIDFEDLAIGTGPGTHYQSQYGITFTGGSVIELNGSKVLSGPFSVAFNPPQDFSRITLQQAQWQDGYTWVTYASGFRDPYWADSQFNPNCRSQAQCASLYQVYIPPDTLFNRTFRSSTNDPIAQIEFITNYADNLHFFAPSWSSNAPIPASQVPVPGTLALLGIGSLFLRRKAKQESELVE